MEMLFVVLSVLGLVAQVLVCVLLWNLGGTLRSLQQSMMALSPMPIVATVPAVGLKGGAVMFLLKSGARVQDMDSSSEFAKCDGQRMLAVFYRVPPGQWDDLFQAAV